MRTGAIVPDVTPSSSRHPGTVLAAGAIVWRRSPVGELEVLLVHSARWDEWSWPKGKANRGESLVAAAVREVREETGVEVELGVPLAPVSYLMPDGRPKSVAYWVARPRHTGDRTAAPTEIDGAQWLPVEAALDRLRPSGRVPGRALLQLAADQALDTTPLLVVRHAKARSRAHWGGGEADRPLTGTGERQAAALAGLLTAWHPPRLLSSPWKRCLDTLQPYLESTLNGTEPEILPLLSEDGLKHDPGRVDALVADLVSAGGNTLVCTHRPVLAAVVGSLARLTPVAVRDRLPHRDPWLSPGEVLVAHVARERVVTVERHVSRS